MYTHLYIGMKFSDDDTMIELYTKAAGLDHHTDSIPYIQIELMTNMVRISFANV